MNIYLYIFSNFNYFVVCKIGMLPIMHWILIFQRNNNMLSEWYEYVTSGMTMENSLNSLLSKKKKKEII